MWLGCLLTSCTGLVTPMPVKNCSGYPEPVAWVWPPSVAADGLMVELDCDLDF